MSSPVASSPKLPFVETPSISTPSYSPPTPSPLLPSPISDNIRSVFNQKGQHIPSLQHRLQTARRGRMSARSTVSRRLDFPSIPPPVLHRQKQRVNIFRQGNSIDDPIDVNLLEDHQYNSQFELLQKMGVVPQIPSSRPVTHKKWLRSLRTIRPVFNNESATVKTNLLTVYQIKKWYDDLCSSALTLHGLNIKDLENEIDIDWVQKILEEEIVVDVPSPFPS